MESCLPRSSGKFIFLKESARRLVDTLVMTTHQHAGINHNEHGPSHSLGPAERKPMINSRTLLLAAHLALALTWPVAASALGTDFTYQGRLTDNGLPANNTYDFQFLGNDIGTNSAFSAIGGGGFNDIGDNSPA